MMMREKPLRIGLAGLGVVGSGVYELLKTNAALLFRRSGQEIFLSAVSARRRKRDNLPDLDGLRWFPDASKLAKWEGIDVFVELIGGADGIAKQAVEEALMAGKHVVTANKSLLATHGTALARMAEKHGASISYEAAIAGAAPAIKTLREALSANHIHHIRAILNGTCNYVLTEMEQNKQSYADALSLAQKNGFAEADPAFDVEGHDSAHKLILLSALAFSCFPTAQGMHVEGIGAVTVEDIEFTHKLGYRIKLLGLARLEQTGLDMRVHPCLVAHDQELSKVAGVSNALTIGGNFSGDITITGHGAGARPTASAVVADLVDIARNNAVLPPFVLPVEQLLALDLVSIKQRQGRNYLRLQVVDQPGAMAAIASALARFSVSIETIIQHGRSRDSSGVMIVILTHECLESNLVQAMTEIDALAQIVAPTRMIRIGVA